MPQEASKQHQFCWPQRGATDNDLRRLQNRDFLLQRQAVKCRPYLPTRLALVPAAVRSHT